MKKLCIFPGSFDPVTAGHYNIVNRALKIFDEVTVLLMTNDKKQYMFSAQKRLNFLHAAFDDTKNVNIQSYDGLLVDFCRKLDCFYVLRGIRNGVDFEYEMHYFGINRQLEPRIEMVFLPTVKEMLYVSSGNVRELISHGGSAEDLVPKGVWQLIK